jgi:23S rRNA U2552 (ribose-2'-O)-methylase RlmE/FtsJ
VDLTLRVLDLAPALLKIGGKGFFKLFEGERSHEVRQSFRRGFEKVKAYKPAASRSSSSELYYFCDGWLGASGPGT